MTPETEKHIRYRAARAKETFEEAKLILKGFAGMTPLGGNVNRR